MSRDLKGLCKSLLKLKSKCKGIGSLVEALSLMEPSLGLELEESGCRQGVSNHYNF